MVGRVLVEDKMKQTFYAYHADHGDGGGHCELFTKFSDLVDEIKDRFGNEAPTDTLSILQEWCDDDPFERGYVETKTVEFDVVDGQLTNLKGFSFHWGQ